ncbi:hypothetical protein [Demequina muriae]|uniref:Phosphotyrosine protein phosphatase I domain-containing protein n=1 Tax=Demequina muriae TaxID=3051664 RepID=A0ABT8GK09_9MICO|nr:hypothetical protein [Demequina sp. EGI L300058]MDN4481766.1 hypothetical protein [Demequina sp. EGI L300058]
MTRHEERILVVCTANRCRSPLAAALLRRHLGTSPVVVTSAGLLPGGETVPEDGRRVASAAGLDLGEHRSTQVTLEMLDAADLVLTASREHSQEIVARAPHLWPRVFTLRQAERWWSEHPRDPQESLRGWVEREAADRPRHEAIGASKVDDIVDPFGRSRRVWRQVLAITDAATASVARGIVGVDDRA